MDYSKPEVTTSYTIMDLYGNGNGFASSAGDDGSLCSTDGGLAGFIDANC